MMNNTLTNDLSKKILNSVVCLYFNKLIDELVFRSKDLRGAIASLYPNEILLHQHREDGTVKYNYPLVQYKCVQGNCILVGIKDGANLISNLHLVEKTIVLPYGKYKILKKDIVFQEEPYGTTKTIFAYSFLSPWLALNEKNYEKYQGLENWIKKKEFLAQILIGNIISMSKGLGYTVSETIKAKINNFKEAKTSLKGTPMLGFLGTFSVNFHIPDYWGIGKSVSRGFGTIERINNNNPAKININ